MAQVVITKNQLDGSHACPVYLDSPEWDEGRKALVFADWDVAVARMLSSRPGTTYLSFLVAKKLVPMTMDEFAAALKTHGGQ